jgi:hypothetical protein
MYSFVSREQSREFGLSNDHPFQGQFVWFIHFPLSRRSYGTTDLGRWWISTRCACFYRLRWYFST